MNAYYRMKILIRFGRYLRRLSIRRRITMAILVTFVLTLPSVGLSMFYFSNLLAEINLIIDKDVSLGRTANEMNLTMLNIRRNERSYRLFGTDPERQRIAEQLTETWASLDTAQSIAPPEAVTILKEMHNDLTIYENSFQVLVDYISEYPPENRIARLRTQISDNLNRTLNDYRNTLHNLENAPTVQRDSLIVSTSQSLDALSIDRLMAGTADDQSGEPTYIQENLDSASQSFLDNSASLAQVSWQNMLDHKAESYFIEARAKRNIITMLILTGIVCMYMIMSFPRKIIRPITSLNQLLKKAGSGDYTARVSQVTNDEIGDLAQNYNHVIDRFREYDTLKSQKIISQKRLIDRLFEQLPQPVCIVTAAMVISFYNKAFSELFEPSLPAKTPENGIPITEEPALAPLMEKVQEQILSGTNTFNFMLSVPEGHRTGFRGRVVRNIVMEPESIIIIAEAGDIPPYS